MFTPFEQQVIDAARGGEALESDDPDNQIRAELIRELLIGRHGDLDPRGIRISGARIAGPLDLGSVRAITGLSLTACALEQVTAMHATFPYLDLSRSQFMSLQANNLRTDHGLILGRVKVRGVIRMIGAQIGAQVDFEAAEVINDTGTALYADRLRTGGPLLLCGATVRGDGADGAIRIVHAHVGGQADFRNAKVTNRGGPALYADGFHAESNLVFAGATMKGSGRAGAVRMLDAQISGTVDSAEAEVVNASGPALHADRLHVDGPLILSQAIVRGNGQFSAIRMHNAHIGAQASFKGAKLTNDDGPALDAASFRTNSDLILDGTTVRASSNVCAVRLVGAQIGDQANLDDVDIINGTGPAVYADGLRTGGTLFLRGATIQGIGDAGAIRMIDAHIGSQLIARRMKVSNPSGPLIRLSEARVDSAVVLPRSVICTELNGHDRNPCPQQDRRITVDRFSFSDLRDVGWREWLHLIRQHTATYSPFPYQQLAAIERAAGHDNNARHILIAQQDDLRRRTPGALGGRVARARHWAWGWLGRYGYRASRLLMALAATLVLAGAVGWVAGQVETRRGHHAAERVLTGAPCSSVELIGLGIDRGLPLGVTGLRAKCDLDTGTRRGQVFTVVIWFIQAAVWALATLAVASYTGLIRKPT